MPLGPPYFFLFFVNFAIDVLDYLEIEATFKDILTKILDKGYSRIPVYRDNIDQIEGVLFVKDLLPHIDKTDFNWTTLIREPFFVPENKKINDLLQEFRNMKMHMAVVVDEYGGASGIITLEDILEEIVGDFTTSMLPTASEEINQQQDGSYLIDASITIRDLNKEMKWDFPTDGPKTLNGLILEYLEDIPSENTSLRLAGYPLEVIEVADNMVKTVRIIPQHYQPPR